MDSRLSRSTYLHPRRITNPVEGLLRNGFPYSRRLQSHTSCVNALAFSSGDGRFLASGGDDLRVKIWDFHQENLTSPSCEFVGPVGNIFTLAFSANNRYLYAGGVCERVYRYDTSNLASATVSKSPEAIYVDSMDSIREISCHPSNENLCIVGSEDGTVRRYDARVSSTSGAPLEGILQLQSEITGVEYHPRMEHLFVTSDNRGNVCLRDERMAFGSLPERSDGGVMRFNTKLSKRSAKHIVRPEVSSLSFDREGERLALTLLHYLPTIYTISDPNPIATCSGECLPDGSKVSEGQRTYVNSCTMKHGHFGGPGLDSDAFYGAGSDDFRGYLWRIPPTSQLLEQRVEVSPVDWWSEKEQIGVAFTEGYSNPKYVPKELSTPFSRLGGHRSIVNTVIFHPQLLHVVTAGIEKDIILHSPTPGSPCTQNLAETPQEVRSISEDASGDRLNYLRSLMGEVTDDDRNEEHTISMFDHILRVEGRGDIFKSNRWIPTSDSSEEDNEDYEDGTTDSSENDDASIFS
ncbi:hypothetical protein D9611_007483 [Ephemerocybe angulata]|uniref:WD40-repeat-containing domain protein n=2 Tax=Ephemerocybe angulata TaxID=980116 RepID=A0A8H6HZJ4_9AGAR|nr:hypothetical protein D9611_007483 [Tulosesus angulatus]KAF6755950.1 WD40-repeat-containing domain protein [Tulosesus angulatus]